MIQDPRRRSSAGRAAVDTIRVVQGNVKRWRSGKMAQRWPAAGMLAAETPFRRINGYRDLWLLERALDRYTKEVNHQRPRPDSGSEDRQKFYDERDILPPAGPKELGTAGRPPASSCQEVCNRHQAASFRIARVTGFPSTNVLPS